MAKKQKSQELLFVKQDYKMTIIDELEIPILVNIYLDEEGNEIIE